MHSIVATKLRANIACKKSEPEPEPEVEEEVEEQDIDLAGTFSYPHSDEPISKAEKLLENLRKGNLLVNTVTRANYSRNDHIDILTGDSLKKIVAEEVQKVKTSSVDISDTSVCLSLCDDIKEKLKSACRNDRYRYVVHATAGGRQRQDVRNATLCLWDVGTDCACTFNFTKGDSFIVVNVYALYTV